MLVYIYYVRSCKMYIINSTGCLFVGSETRSEDRWYQEWAAFFARAVFRRQYVRKYLYIYMYIYIYGIPPGAYPFIYTSLSFYVGCDPGERGALNLPQFRHLPLYLYLVKLL